LVIQNIHRLFLPFTRDHKRTPFFQKTLLVFGFWLEHALPTFYRIILCNHGREQFFNHCWYDGVVVLLLSDLSWEQCEFCVVGVIELIAWLSLGTKISVLL